MNVPVLTLFNPRAGVGKTWLTYHLAWMCAELGHRVVALDMDPQASLTATCLGEDRVADLWSDAGPVTTIYRAVQPLRRGGELRELRPLELAPNVFLIPAELALAEFEETLAGAWLGDSRSAAPRTPERLLTAFWQAAQSAAKSVAADLIITDTGPNLGALNRTALVGSDYVLTPLAADPYSLPSLRTMGPTLTAWRDQWRQRLEPGPASPPIWPIGQMHPLGYLIERGRNRFSNAVAVEDAWFRQVPDAYREGVLHQPATGLTVADDPHCLATLKPYRSLAALARDARKPLFQLTPADGAMGSHAVAARDAAADFRILAEKILGAMAAGPETRQRG